MGGRPKGEKLMHNCRRTLEVCSLVDLGQEITLHGTINMKMQPSQKKRLDSVVAN